MRFISWGRLLISIILSYLVLAFNGLWKIRADNNIYSSASLLLIIAQVFVYLTVVFFGYHILGGLKNPHRRKVLIIAGVIFIATWLFVLDNYFVPSYFLYVPVGNILRDRYGINWFWMDWGVWFQCFTVYLFGTYLYLVNMLAGILLPKSQVVRKSRKK